MKTPTPLRLPKRLRCFPGFNIKIKQVTRKWLMETYSNPNEELHGVWDVDAMTIYIQKTLDGKAKFKVYAHELQHALVDWTSWIEDQKSG